MAAVKIVLRKKKTKDNTYPLAIRITKDRKASFIHLGKDIKESDWNSIEQRVKKSHPNSARLNNFLIKKLADASNSLLELEIQKTEVSSHAVKQRIKPIGGSTFFKQAEIYLTNLKEAGKYNQYTADKPRIGHFREFLKGEDIAFSDISVSLLQRFKGYLKRDTQKEGKIKKMGDRTIINHLVVIRSVFSQAVKENITDKKYYPFGAGKIQIKFPESIKIGLSPAEVTLLEQVSLKEGSFENHARNLWLFSFYFAGMRASDVLRLRWSDIQNDRLHYTMGKNAKGGSLKLPEKALKILQQYENGKNDKDSLIFPDLKRLDNLSNIFITQRTIAFTVSRIDKYLRLHVAPAAKIEKNLTMHIARHTFGNISGDKIPLQMLQKLYRHSSIVTTIGYQANFIHKDADAALEAVIQF
jgi:site-specific recombinase XerD